MKYTVILSHMCPCEQCAGELIGEPEIFNTDSLEEAVDTFRDWAKTSIWESNQPDPPIESSSWPISEGDWLHRSISVFGGDCKGEDLGCKEVSFHVSREQPVTVSTLKRIKRLLEG